MRGCRPMCHGWFLPYHRTHSSPSKGVLNYKNFKAVWNGHIITGVVYTYFYIYKNTYLTSPFTCNALFWRKIRCWNMKPEYGVESFTGFYRLLKWLCFFFILELQSKRYFTKKKVTLKDSSYSMTTQNKIYYFSILSSKM